MARPNYEAQESFETRTLVMALVVDMGLKLENLGNFRRLRDHTFRLAAFSPTTVISTSLV